MNTSITPLEKYVRDCDEEAFRQLVRDYFNLVHGPATRLLNGDAELALDVCQIVFTDLATKAHSLPKDVMLGGWLHRHTCFVAANTLRTERRRLAREQTAIELNAMHSGDDDGWRQLAPELDAAIEELDETDRNALLLRFFEGRDLRSVGEALRISEDAAQKRVQRAIEKLRTAFERRGVSVTSVALVSFLTSRLASPVSAAGIESIASAALARVPLPGGLLPMIVTTMKAKIAILLVLLLALSIPFLWKNRPRSVTPDNQPSAAAMENGSPDSIQAQVEGATSQALAGVDNPYRPEMAFPTDTAPQENVQRIALRVLDRVSRQPVAGATVRAAEQLLLTDETGALAWPVSNPASKLQLNYSKEGYTGWVDIWEPGKGEAIPAEHTVLLEAAVEIGGTVQNNEGLPVEGVAVRMVRYYRGDERIDRSNHRMEPGSYTNYTDANGRWMAKRFSDALLEKVGLTFSHPDYATTNSPSSPDQAGLLRVQKHLVTLTAGTHLFGIVTDTNGIPIAGAKVTVGAQNDSSQKNGITDEYGKYEIRNVVNHSSYEKNVLVTVMADSFAPATKPILPEKESMELNFAMNPGGVIRGRVLNSRQEPIAGVRVSRDGPEEQGRGINWSKRTDSDGRFEWLGAPLTLQTFYFGHPDYVQIRAKPLNAQDDEHLVVLNDTRLAKGTVHDAKTGKAVELFSVMPAAGTRERLLRWSSSEEKDFTGGTFSLPLGEEHYNALRIRATGYVSAIYPVPQHAENELIEARLEPASVLRGTVVDASGKAISRAQVVAVSGATSARSVSLAPGRLSQFDRSEDKTLTNEAGEFDVYSTAVANWIVVVADAGFGHITVEALEQQGTVILAPWGSVEGNLTEDGKPGAGLDVRLTTKANRDGVSLDINSYKAKTDVQGRFRFDKVPPRAMNLVQMVPIVSSPSKSGGARSFALEHLTNFVVAPGTLTQIQVPAFQASSPP